MTFLAHEFNNEAEQLAWQATNEIWNNLMNRAGFDQVMAELSVPDENEILGEIRKIIQEKLEKGG